VVPVSSEIVAGADIDNLVSDMFPNVVQGVAVRTVLRYEDLLRMRKVFVWYARNNADLPRCCLEHGLTGISRKV
jgi:hypothetical protein